MSEVKSQFDRVKGAEWFPLLHKRDVMVLGQGGIGSWTSLLLARAGCELHIFDMDRYEEHNMTGQLVGQSSIGELKTEAVAKLIKELSPDTAVYKYAAYAHDSPSNEIVICGFDNMKARKLAFEKWTSYINGLSEVQKRDCFFQDGRLLAEQMQVFNIPGDRPDLMELYEKDWLFDDEEGSEGDCTFKQTSHAAAMIASHMVGFLTNWVSGGVRKVPFMYEYMIPLNLATSINSTINYANT